MLAVRGKHVKSAGGSLPYEMGHTLLTPASQAGSSARVTNNGVPCLPLGVSMYSTGRHARRAGHVFGLAE